MELIPYSRFERLRLADFYPDAGEIEQLDDWEYMDEMWIGESVGFTAFLRPDAQPECLGAIELDLADLPDGTAEVILQRIHLPLAKGMPIARIVQLLGAPGDPTQFIADRKSYDFIVGREYPYLVSCTVHESQGLIFLGVAREDMIGGSGTLVEKMAARVKRGWQALKASVFARNT